jgi:hypothetical protein
MVELDELREELVGARALVALHVRTINDCWYQRAA